MGGDLSKAPTMNLASEPPMERSDKRDFQSLLWALKPLRRRTYARCIISMLRLP